MTSPWLGVAGVLAALAAFMGLLKLLEHLAHPHPELLRKLMHVGTGLVAMCLPFVFKERWPILLLSAVAFAALACVKWIPRLREGIGTVLNAVHRPSLGELCFPIAVGTLALVSGGEKLLFCVPILIMTLADTAAALVGVAYGKIRYVTSDGLKSAEGSIAFFSIAFFSVHVPLLLHRPDVGRTECLLIAIVIGLLAMLLEAIASRGMDNLLIPIGAYAFLRLYIHASAASLEFRLQVLLCLVAFVLLCRRLSSMNDSALIAAALFGYGAWMLGGLGWLAGPLALFLAHVFLWPRSTDKPTDTLPTLAAAVGPGFFWLIVHLAAPREPAFVPYAVSFASQIVTIAVFRIRGNNAKPLATVLGVVMAGAMLVLIQTAPAPASLAPLTSIWVLAISVICLTVTVSPLYVVRERILRSPWPRAASRLAAAIAATAASLLAWAVALHAR